MITVARLDDGRALLIYDPSQIPPGEPTMEVETIPPGKGLLMTDLSSLWWEEVPPQPEPEPENPITLEELQKENKMLKAQLQAQVDRSDFIEDCIAEMATVVYGGV